RGFAEIERLDGLLNYFSEDSEITAVNRAAGNRPVRVSRETLDIMKKAVHISEITGGAFDPTIAPVVSLWNFSKDVSAPSIPSRDTVEDALRHVDYRKIEINTAASEIYLTEKGMEIDLGGIAKGYAADRAVEALKAEGIKAALVAVAGDIRGFGLNPAGQGWRLGIQDPRPETVSERPWEDIVATLELRDKAISTSGDYQRFFIKDGRRYFHILDPGTGFPAETDLISVTVIAPEGYVTDSLATAVFVLGVEKGMKLLESMGIDGVLICADKKILLTENLKGKINILNAAYQAVDHSP
ncbi:MAG: FAD:protein FMN transferase, partial [Deferribacteres bacterium]|nr:FAD:protein FMN transferase [Deferribacteres bacterium]